MTRKSMSRKERSEFFTKHGGVCCYCTGKIKQGEAWEAAHLKDRALMVRIDPYTGEEVWVNDNEDPDDPENMLPAHKKCHAGYTFGGGNQIIAKVKRLADKQNGFRKPSTFPKRFDPWQKQRRLNHH